MKSATSRMKSALRAHALDWITAVLAAMALALFILAMARAVSAAPTGYRFDAVEREPERRARVETAETKLERRLGEIVGEFAYYIESLERVFERDLQSLEKEVSEVFGDYESGGTRREFDHQLKSLEVRLDQLARRIHKRATAAGLPRPARPL